jgi:predicted ATPase
MLTTLAISNYRSLRELLVPFKSTKRNHRAERKREIEPYRALRLLVDTAQGRVVPSLGREGGLQSTLWAGPESISRKVRQGDSPFKEQLENSLSVFALALRETSLAI